MAYNKFRWWTGGKLHKPLPERTPLLLKILNGDYEYSYMFEEAKLHRLEANQAYELAYKNYIGSTLAGKIEAALNAGKMKRLKAIKGEIEAGLNEIRILDKLRRDLKKEFSNDYWDEVFNSNFDGSTLDLYFKYKELSGLQQTPSEFDIRYGRNGSSRYRHLLEKINETVS